MVIRRSYARSLFSAFCASQVIAVVCQADDLEKINREALQILNRPHLQKNSEIRSEISRDKGKLLAILKAVFRGKIKTINGEAIYPADAAVALVKYGDVETISDIVESIGSEDWGETPGDLERALYAGQPAVIPFVAPHLLLDEPSDDPNLKRPFGDLFPQEGRVSFRAADIICAILASRDEPNAAVREWADLVPRNSTANREGYRQAVRDWWTANEKAVRDQKYNDLRPGHLYPIPSSGESWEQTKARLAAFKATQRENAKPGKK